MNGTFQAIHNFFKRCISMPGRCHVLPCLNEFIGVVLSCFMLSLQSRWMEVLITQPEDWLRPLFKAVVYSRSWVRKLVNSQIYVSDIFQKAIFRVWVLTFQDSNFNLVLPTIPVFWPFWWVTGLLLLLVCFCCVNNHVDIFFFLGTAFAV